MKRRYDPIADLIYYRVSDDQEVCFERKYVQRYGLDAALRSAGVELPCFRIPVEQGGRVIGSMANTFEPLATRSTRFLYEPRPNDFRFERDRWIAANQLGPGDLEAIPEFSWVDKQQEAGRSGRAEDDRRWLREALLAGRKPENEADTTEGER